MFFQQNFQHTKLYSFQNLSLGFILKIFLNSQISASITSLNILIKKKECKFKIVLTTYFPHPKIDNTACPLSRLKAKGKTTIESGDLIN